MTEKTHIKVLLIGFGNVGQKIADIIVFEKNKFPGLNGLKINIVGIITRSRGSLANQKGVNISRALKEIKSTESFLPSNPDFCQMNGCRATEELDYDVMVELSTLSIEKKGEPSISYVEKSLTRGRHVVTANKGPVAFAFQKLKRLAGENNVQFLYESTVMDGAPVFNMARNNLKGCKITGLSGILNSTSNYILSKMEIGESFDEALRTAREKGIVEADVKYDIEGWDAAAKIVALSNVLMGADITPPDISREGISKVTQERVKNALKKNKHLKLICRSEIKDGLVKASVRLEEISQNHPFALVSGMGNILRIETDLMGPIFITQENPTLYDTAYGVLEDMLTIQDHYLPNFRDISKP
ncbi:MAG: hypothetical protein KAX05_01470 [Bacteroidales bacterium]|nr:hypothetical protein [Bacteroidales bacterium]